MATAERRERNSLASHRNGYRTAPTSARTPPQAPHTLPIPLPTPHTLSPALDPQTVLAQRDAARTHVHGEVMKLAERYKALEKTLREMQDALRMKDRESGDAWNAVFGVLVPRM